MCKPWNARCVALHCATLVCVRCVTAHAPLTSPHPPLVCRLVAQGGTNLLKFAEDLPLLSQATHYSIAETSALLKDLKRQATVLQREVAAERKDLEDEAAAEAAEKAAREQEAEEEGEAGGAGSDVDAGMTHTHRNHVSSHRMD